MIFNYRHPHIPAGMEGDFIYCRAFDGDFHRNGPSIVRIVRMPTLAGWKWHKNDPDVRIRRRYAWEARELGDEGLPPPSPAESLPQRAGNAGGHPPCSTICTASSAGNRASPPWAAATCSGGFAATEVLASG